MLCALIMAGGKGTRFWPASTEERPKQFLKLINNKTMIQNTVDRIEGFIDYKNIFVCTSAKYVAYIKEQLPLLPDDNIIVEPVGRNTAPCILLSTLYIKQKCGTSNIIVLPSDHAISKQKNFLSVIKSADAYIDSNPASIITLGILPSRPETGYGYIKYVGDIININNHEVKKVERFVEKPSVEKAITYLNEGSYLWNAGMFVFNSTFMLAELKKYYSHGYDLLNRLPSIDSKKYKTILEKCYLECEPISIDYAVMEKSSGIKVIPADIGWDDIGSWQSLKRYLKPDNNDNFFNVVPVLDNCENNLIFSEETKKIICLGIKDLFCINTNDVLIIGSKDELNNIIKYRGEI